MGRPKNNIDQFDSRLDWLSLSAYLDTRRRLEFEEFSWYLQGALVEQGEMEEPVRIPRYQGTQINGVKFLKRELDGHRMIIASGINSVGLADQVIEHNPAAKCTRIDGALTAQFKTPNKVYAQQLRRKVRAHEKDGGRETQTPIDTYERCHADSGLVIGSKKSAAYIRVYDYGLKHLKRYDSLIWRYEAQLEEEAAASFWGKYRLSADKAKLTSEMVTTRLKKLGINELAFERFEPCHVAGTKPLTTDERSLLWLKEQVLPKMSGLKARGFAKQLCDMLREERLLDQLGVFVDQEPYI